MEKPASVCKQEVKTLVPPTNSYSFFTLQVESWWMEENATTIKTQYDGNKTILILKLSKLHILLHFSIYKWRVNTFWCVKNIFRSLDELFRFWIHLPTVSPLFCIGLLFTRTVARVNTLSNTLDAINAAAILKPDRGQLHICYALRCICVYIKAEIPLMHNATANDERECYRVILWNWVPFKLLLHKYCLLLITDFN